MGLTSGVSFAAFLLPELINIFYQVGKEMSNNSAEENYENPLLEDDEKDEEGSYCMKNSEHL